MDLWSEASRDVEAENDGRRFLTAKVATSDWWSFFATAETRGDLINRLALVQDRLDSVVAATLPEDVDPHEVLALSARVSGSLIEDWETAHPPVAKSASPYIPHGPHHLMHEAPNPWGSEPVDSSVPGNSAVEHVKDPAPSTQGGSDEASFWDRLKNHLVGPPHDPFALHATKTAGDVPPEFLEQQKKKSDDKDDSNTKNDKGTDDSGPGSAKWKEQQDGTNGDSKSDPDDDGKAEDGSSNSAQKDDDSKKSDGPPPWVKEKSSARVEAWNPFHKEEPPKEPEKPAEESNEEMMRRFMKPYLVLGDEDEEKREGSRQDGKTAAEGTHACPICGQAHDDDKPFSSPEEAAAYMRKLLEPGRTGKTADLLDPGQAQRVVNWLAHGGPPPQGEDLDAIKKMYDQERGRQASLRAEADNEAPYRIEGNGPYKVVNSNGDVKGTHGTRDEALAQQRALYANVPGAREKAEADEKKKSSSLESLLARSASLVTALGEQFTSDNPFGAGNDMAPGGMGGGSGGMPNTAQPGGMGGGTGGAGGMPMSGGPEARPWQDASAMPQTDMAATPNTPDPTRQDTDSLQRPASKTASVDKVARITAGVLATNPGMEPAAARQIAEETVLRYPGSQKD